VGNAINNRGQTVGSSGHYSLSARGYIYAGGTFTEIDGPQNGYDTTANGINDWGQVVGGLAPNGTVATVPPGPPEAYICQNGSVTKMFSYPGATSTTATGINDWGQIVGYYSDGTTSAGGVTQPADQGFLYASGTMRTIDVPGAPLTDLMAINNVGEIVGSYFDGTHWHGFIDQGGRMSFVNAPGAADTWINSVNDLGQIAGAFDTSSSNPRTGFVATPGTAHNLLADLNAMLPKQVSQVIGNSSGHAYFDPTLQPVMVPAAPG
jgi:uncharacterized membrane protein